MPKKPHYSDQGGIPKFHAGHVQIISKVWLVYLIIHIILTGCHHVRVYYHSNVSASVITIHASLIDSEVYSTPISALHNSIQILGKALTNLFSSKKKRMQKPEQN